MPRAKNSRQSPLECTTYPSLLNPDSLLRTYLIIGTTAYWHGLNGKQNNVCGQICEQRPCLNTTYASRLVGTVLQDYHDFSSSLQRVALPTCTYLRQ